MISKLKPQGLARDIQDAVTAVDEEFQKLREENSYFYENVEKRVIELDQACHLLGEAKAEEKTLQNDKYTNGETNLMSKERRLEPRTWTQERTYKPRSGT